ncbi:MAG: hypothetical protein ACTSUE_11630 [Promethearchaeota archaeon]
MKSCLEPREERVTKLEMKRPVCTGPRSLTKQATALGPCGGKSHVRFC